MHPSVSLTMIEMICTASLRNNSKGFDQTGYSATGISPIVLNKRLGLANR